MRILDSIISTIEHGVYLMRAHAHDEVKEIKATAHEVKEKIEDIKAKVKTDFRGPASTDEIHAFLAECAKEVPDATDYDRSAVDLMKVLKYDPSLAARKEMAQDLGYTGALNGSAVMNIWLHDAVMARLADRERTPVGRVD
jgi:hypothetical protein